MEVRVSSPRQGCRRRRSCIGVRLGILISKTLRPRVLIISVCLILSNQTCLINICLALFLHKNLKLVRVNGRYCLRKKEEEEEKEKEKKRKKKKNGRRSKTAAPSSNKTNSVQFSPKVVPTRPGKLICAPPRLPEVSPMLNLERSQCWPD